MAKSIAKYKTVPRSLANHGNGIRLSAEEAIREVQGTRLAMLRSTIALARAYLRRAEQPRDRTAATRSLLHARASYGHAERLLSANELGPAATESLRHEIFALRRELEDAEARAFGTPSQRAV